MEGPALLDRKVLGHCPQLLLQFKQQQYPIHFPILPFPPAVPDLLFLSILQFILSLCPFLTFIPSLPVHSLNRFNKVPHKLSS